MYYNTSNDSDEKKNPHLQTISDCSKFKNK